MSQRANFEIPPGLEEEELFSEEDLAAALELSLQQPDTEEPSSVVALHFTVNPQEINTAFIAMEKFALENGLATLTDCDNLELRCQTAQGLVPLQLEIGMGVELKELIRIAKKPTLSSADEGLLSRVQATITSSAGAQESCGAESSRFCEIILGKNAEAFEEQKFARLEKSSDLLDAISAVSKTDPVLVRVEIYREEIAKARLSDEKIVKEINTHSYCLLVLPGDGATIYQGYFGKYGISEWICNPKFEKEQKNCALGPYVDKLVLLASKNNADVSKAVYGSLYRLPGTEDEVSPNKWSVLYKVAPLMTRQVLSNIACKKAALIEVRKELTSKRCSTAEEYISNACWEDLCKKHPEIKREDVMLLKTRTELVAKEIAKQMSLFQRGLA